MRVDHGQERPPVVASQRDREARREGREDLGGADGLARIAPVERQRQAPAPPHGPRQALVDRLGRVQEAPPPLAPRGTDVLVQVEHPAAFQARGDLGETALEVLDVMQGLVEEGGVEGPLGQGESIEILAHVGDLPDPGRAGVRDRQRQGAGREVDAHHPAAQRLAAQIALERAIAVSQSHRPLESAGVPGREPFHRPRVRGAGDAGVDVPPHRRLGQPRLDPTGGEGARPVAFDRLRPPAAEDRGEAAAQHGRGARDPGVERTMIPRRRAGRIGASAHSAAPLESEHSPAGGGGVEDVVHRVEGQVDDGQVGRQAVGQSRAPGPRRSRSRSRRRRRCAKRRRTRRRRRATGPCPCRPRARSPRSARRKPPPVAA